MNAFASTVYRDLSCGMTATLITLMLSVTFVQATSVAPATRAAHASFVAIGPVHGWLGQPRPAVLVD